MQWRSVGRAWAHWGAGQDIIVSPPLHVIGVVGLCLCKHSKAQLSFRGGACEGYCPSTSGLSITKVHISPNALSFALKNCNHASPTGGHRATAWQGAYSGLHLVHAFEQLLSPG